MGKLINLFTEQLQLWLGHPMRLTPQVVADLLAKARLEALKDVEAVKIRVEGEPRDVMAVLQLIREVLQVSEKKVNTAILPGGRIRRELDLAVKKTEAQATRPGHLDPSKVAGEPPPSASQRPPVNLDKLIYESLLLLARGLLEFPTDEEGNRVFSSFAYPATFETGISKLTDFLFSHNVVIDSSIKYWQLLSTPLTQWPHMPASLQAPQAMIDQEGRPTQLTEHLAQQPLP